MSSREELIVKAYGAMGEVDRDHWDLPERWQVDTARAIVDALMPEITEPRQMKDVPERSILVVNVMGGVVPVRWQNDLIYGDLRADKMPIEPVWVLDRYGPMTVVWMP